MVSRTPIDIVSRLEFTRTQIKILSIATLSSLCFSMLIGRVHDQPIHTAVLFFKSESKHREIKCQSMSCLLF